jgi:bacteriocin biosynthesis cyclodehydratase domain-containing protein
MVLRLDPAYPILWRSPGSLQLGVDDPPAVFPEVTIAQERLLAALRVGATRSGVSLLGRASGLSDREIAEFHRTVSPALERRPPRDRPPVVVAGSGPTVDRLAWRLTEAGLTPRLVGSQPEAAVATPRLRAAPLAVLVTHYIPDPAYLGLWLRHDVPHLPVVFGDTSVRIGPLVEPGRTACLYCVERHRADADPAWPVLASQLGGTRGLAETPLLASEAALRAARLALHRIRADVVEPGRLPSEWRAGASVTIDAETGAVLHQGWAPHPDCACRGLPLAPAARPAGPGRVRPGTGTARSRSGRPTSTTTGRASSVPA